MQQQQQQQKIQKLGFYVKLKKLGFNVIWNATHKCLFKQSTLFKIIFQSWTEVDFYELHF